MVGEMRYRWQMTEPGKPMSKVAFDPPPLGADEALVQIAGCGVHHIHLGFFYDGVRTNRQPPLTLGHEISGRVETHPLEQINDVFRNVHDHRLTKRAILVP
jgi:D-arabinose 1-dehydrogenase-like Zn-dependent alcohol dehydrogenase